MDWRAGFSRYVNAEDADILVVTETKTPEMDLPALNDRYEVRLSVLSSYSANLVSPDLIRALPV